MLYRDFKSQRKLSREYDPLENIGGMAALKNLLSERTRLSRDALAQINVILDIPYGPTLKEKLDFYPTGRSNLPIVLFIHGGYWVDTRITKDKFAWIAKSFVAKGFNTAIMDYAVAPSVTIDEIVRECRAVIAWLYRHGSSYDANPSSIYLVGNSVGAHLLAMATAADWEEEYGLPQNIIKGGCAISGIYDLEPIPYTWIQPMLQLEWGAVRRNSPLYQVPSAGPPLLISYGTSETSEFQRQSTEFASAWKQNGNSVETFVQNERNHFTVMSGFSNPDSELMNNILLHMQQAGIVL